MKLGPYELEGALGEGGAAIVYRARGPDGASVAVKLLRRQDPQALARFERERALQGVLGEEDGFVPLVDWGVSPRGPYLVMPFLPGGTLRDRLDRGRLEPKDTIALARALADALGAAHAASVAHRDLKPENVIFAADGTPLVADLGLAKHFGKTVEESFCVSRTGLFTGTAGYAAPEQVRDAKNAGPRADVFALGAILYECLAGEPAFRADELIALLRRVGEGPPEPLAKRCPAAPAWLVKIVETALAQDAAKRFADGDAVLAALEAEEWGLEAAKRAPKRRRVPPRAPPPPVDELEVPPSSAARTELLGAEPVDVKNLLAPRPEDAPLTIKIADIPFAVGEADSAGGSDSAVAPDSGPVAPLSPAPPPAPRSFLARLLHRLRGG
jgi:serine/threonine protein kinase